MALTHEPKSLTHDDDNKSILIRMAEKPPSRLFNLNVQRKSKIKKYVRYARNTFPILFRSTYDHVRLVYQYPYVLRRACCDAPSTRHTRAGSPPPRKTRAASDTTTLPHHSHPKCAASFTYTLPVATRTSILVYGSISVQGAYSEGVVANTIKTKTRAQHRFTFVPSAIFDSLLTLQETSDLNTYVY